MLDELRQGWHAVRERSWVWATLAAFSTSLLVALAPFLVLGAAVARDVYGSEAVFGIANAFWGVGTLTGALVGTRWKPQRPMLAAMLAAAGLARTQYDFSDGSGMSSYNRVSPRGAVAFLRWAAAQPWGAALRDDLPLAGVDGTLASRFRKTPLEGRLSAKTGTLNAATALTGYMTGTSGRTFAFAAFAADMPEGAEASKAIDAALVAIAASN
jgi:hypothetical protein